MRHQSQNLFRGLFVGIQQHQKGYLVYVPSTCKIVSSHDIISDKIFSSQLSYKSHPYSESLNMQPAISYIPYDTSYHEQTGDIITFAQFEGVNLVQNEGNEEEDEFISASIDQLYTYDDYDDGSISMNTPEDIQYGSQVHPEVNTRYAT